MSDSIYSSAVEKSPNTAEMANRLLQKIPSKANDYKQFDILLVILIIKLILLAWECIQLYPNRALNESRDPGFFVRWKLRRIIKEKLNDAESDMTTQEVYEAVIKMGGEITTEELKLISEEARS